MSQTALWTLGLLGVLVLAFACTAFHGPRIEADLRASLVEAAAADASLAGISADLVGRTVFLRGSVPDEAARQRALAAAAAIPGISRVVDELTVEGGAAAPGAAAMAFALDRDGDGLVVRGIVPDEATRARILAQIRAAFPGRTVRDALTISADADGGWTSSLDGMLTALAALPDGAMQIDGRTVILRGTAPTGEARAEIEAAARAALPEGYTLRNEIAVGDGSADAPASAADDQIESSGSTDADVQAGEAALREVLALGQIEFESGTATLTAESQQILERAAAVFTEYPALGAEVQGHSDSQGDDASNLALSQRRAESVRDYLVGQGVDTAALSPQGYGEAEPIADNDTAEGRARNRRVVFSLRAR